MAGKPDTRELAREAIDRKSAGNVQSTADRIMADR
jgi:hypothetical protein